MRDLLLAAVSQLALALHRRLECAATPAGESGARRSAVALIALFLGSAILAQEAVTPSTGTHVPELAAYDNLAASLLAKYQIPGGAIAVVRDGRLVFARGYGYANKASGELVQPDSAFRIASLSKAITSAAILLLVQRGKLDLDRRVFDLIHPSPLPGATADPRLAAVTVRELLHHLGGWDRKKAHFDPMFNPGIIAAAAGTAPPASAETIIRYMMGKPLQFDPGSDYSYSNYGYALLGRVVEAVSGQAYERFVREQVLASSGAACMRIGRSLGTQALSKEVAYYDYPGAPLKTSVFGTGLEVPEPNGGFYLEAMDSHGGWVGSTVDYLRFALSVDARASRPDILSLATVRTMTECLPIPIWNCASRWYGMGWNIVKVGEDANWYHSGSLAGTATIVVRNADGMAWAAFFNSRPQDEEAFFDDLDHGLRAVHDGIQPGSWPSNDEFSAFGLCSGTGVRRRAVQP
jgi:N-acyl-D-amino-acid deacylase